jgi:hypothetical protein
VKVLEPLLAALRERCASLPDRRVGMNSQYTMKDIGMAAFSVFFMQNASFLQHQKRLQEGQGLSNCQTLFDIEKIPTENHIREHLDGVSPAHFDSNFSQAVRMFLAEDNLAAFRRLEGKVLIALDGTEYFKSYKVHCSNCSHRVRKNEKKEYFHTFLGATIVSPGHQHVVPLPPEFITPQDGHDKQDSEPTAAKRWLGKHGQEYADLKPVYLGDDLYAKQPMCAAVVANRGKFIFVCKPDSHPTISEYLASANISEYTMSVQKGKKNGGKTYTHIYRWSCDIPLRKSADALIVNWMQMDILDDKGKITYHNSWITNIPIQQSNVVELVACGRSRWKIENEKFNVLKNNGYNLSHNFGHGKLTLASMLVVLNLLAFTFHTVCDFIEQAWRHARTRLHSRRMFFEQMRAATYYFVFPTWYLLMEGLFQPP